KGYFYDDSSPVQPGKVNMRGKSSYGYSGQFDIKPEWLPALSKIFGYAHAENEELGKTLVPRAEAAKKEREERQKRADEGREQMAKFAKERREVINDWLKEVVESLKWLEGQAGRLKRRSKKGYDVFHEL